MNPLRKSFVISALVVGVAHTAIAGQHTWKVNEVFSNASGTIQFVELREGNGTPGEVNINGVTVTSTTKSFPIGGSPVAAPTSNKFFLIATPAFAALSGAPTPDRIVAPGTLHSVLQHRRRYGRLRRVRQLGVRGGADQRHELPQPHRGRTAQFAHELRRCDGRGERRSGTDRSGAEWAEHGIGSRPPVARGHGDPHPLPSVAPSSASAR